MKRFITGTILAAALFATAVCAQDGLQFGIRASLVAHSTYDDTYDYSPGLGYGAGLVVKYSVSEALNFSSNPSLYYRSLYSYVNGVSLDELALCIPIAVNYFVSLDRYPIYVSGGLELDVPFNTKRFEYANGMDIDNRSAVDIGFLIGAGYMITDNIGVDARYIVYFNEPRDGDSELLMSYGIGVFLLF